MRTFSFIIFKAHHILLSLVVISFLASACATSKKAAKTEDVSIDNAVAYKALLNGLDDRYPDYTSMASDIRLEADIDGESYRASGLIRHVRDQGVFLSVRKFGFELGRVLITQDSFYVLNRWEKEYIKEPIAIIEREYEIKGDFGLVEELLTGIPRISNYRKNERTIIDQGAHRVDVSSVHKDIDLTMWIEPDNHIRQAYYQDNLDRGIMMSYDDERKNKVVIERELRTENIEDNEIYVKLGFKNPRFNATTLPAFTIPSHYSRRMM